MKKGILVFLVLTVAAGLAFANPSTSNVLVYPEKPVDPMPYNQADHPVPERQGGDTIAGATVIPGLPYNDTGTTTGYTNDYDEVCPYTGSTAPDVVYSYAPAVDETIDIDLLGSLYDTKLYVYENMETSGSPYACNDDFYPDYVSAIFGLDIFAGNTYYIVVDGYDTDNGDYVIDIQAGEACVVECPEGGIPESEPCGDDTNGGCNMDPGPQVWEPIFMGDTICGTLWADTVGEENLRDTDWFEFTASGPMQVVLTGEAELPFVLGNVDGPTPGAPDCATITSLNPYATGNPCEVIQVVYDIPVAGTYWFFAAPQDFLGYPCDNNYWISLTPGAGLEPLTISPTEWDFGDVMVGESNSQTFTLTNNESYAFEIIDVDIVDPLRTAADYDLTLYNSYPYVISPGESLLVDVEFTPAAVGESNAILLVDYNTGVRDVITADLYGNGVGSDPYCESGATSSADSVIEGVIFGDINNISGPVCAQYTDFTGMSTDITQGTTYPLEVITGTCGGCYGKWVKVFIDWNQDNDFDDPDEQAYTSGMLSSGCPHSFFGNITVPVGATLGATRMRVVARESGSEASTLACGTYTWGETEDYTVNIVEPSADPAFSVTPSNYDFGDVFAGFDSDPQTFTVSNIGAGGQVIVTGVALANVPIRDAADFQLLDSNSYPVALNSFETLTFDVIFSPDDLGFSDANVVIEYNTTSRETADVYLSGTGVEPSYCPSGATSSSDSVIEGVIFNTIDNISGPVCAQYTDFTDISTEIFQGGTFPLEVITGTCGGCYGKWAKVFIDWNQDYDFDDPDEQAWTSGMSSSGCPYSFHGNITVPVGATLGETRMRVVMREGGSETTTQACGTYTWGETEDYTVIITTPPPPGVIFGNVSSVDYRAPIEYAEVTGVSDLGMFTTTTDASGNYTLDVYVNEDGPAIYTVYCSAFGYLDGDPQTVNVYEDTRIGTEVNFVLDRYLPEPMGLFATSGDGVVDLTWQEPSPMGEIAVDDGTTEANMWVGGPSNTNQMFYTRLTAPALGSVTHVAVLDYRNNDDPVAIWENIWVCPDNGFGLPDLTAPYATFSGVVPTPFQEFNLLELPAPFPVAYGDDFYVVTNWPDGSLNGPYVSTDSNTGGNSGWTNTAGTTWNSWSGTFVMRGYMSVGTRAAVEITFDTYETNATLPEFSVDSKGSEIGTDVALSLPVPHLYPVNGYERAILGYNVYRGTESGNYDPTPVVSVNPDLFYQDNSVTNETKYYYTVSAVYDLGPFESGYSNEAEAAPQYARTITYEEDFEADDGGYLTAGTPGEWEWGELPPARIPVAPYSGSKLWGTDLDDTYEINSWDWLITVPFDLSGEDLVYMDFASWIYTESCCDSGLLYADANNDGTFEYIAEWAGNSLGWVVETVVIPQEFYTDYVRFAFILDSDSSINYDGWYIDDVRLYDPLTPVVFNEDVGIDVDYSVYFGAGMNISVTPAADITATVNGDVVTYINAVEHWNGVSSAVLTVDDGTRVPIYDKEIEVIVNPVNDAPTIVLPDEIHFDEDTVDIVDFTPYINDVDGDDLVLTYLPATNITITVAGLDVTMTNVVEHWNGSEPVTFRVNDQAGRLIAEDDVLIVVDPVNDLPVVANPVADVVRNEDFGMYTVGDGDVIFFDPDNDLEYSAEVSDPSIVTAIVDGSLIKLQSILNQYTTTPITLTITASEIGVRGQTKNPSMNSVKMNSNSRAEVSDIVMVTINPVNDAPTIVLPDTFTLMEEGTLVEDFTPYLFDVDGDDLVLTSPGSAHIQVDITGFEVTFTAFVLNWNGSESVTFTVNDQQGRAIATDNVIVQVTPVNDPPTIDIPSTFTFNEGGSLSVNFAPYVNDVDNDPLVLTVAGNTEIDVTIVGLNVTFSTFDPYYYGQEELTFTVDDQVNPVRLGDRDTASDVTTVTVNYVNDPPEYSGPTYINLLEDFGTHTIGNMNDLFIDVDPPEFTDLVFEIVSFNANKINAYIDGNEDLIIESVDNANGLSTLRVKATDNDSYGARASLSTTQDIQIDMLPVNDPPVLFDLPEEINMAANSVQFLNLENNWYDVDDDNPIMTIESPEGFVVVTRLPGYDYRFRISAQGMFGMSDYITVYLNDGHGRAIASEDILVTIAASEPPYITFMIPNQEYPEDFPMSYIINLDECFNDPDDEFLNYAVTVLNEEGGNPVISADIDEENGLWLGANIPDWNGLTSIRIDCWDRLDSRFVVSQTVGVIVTPVNDAPVVIAEIADQMLDEDFASFAVANLIDIFYDVDGDVLTYGVTAVTPGVVNPVIVGSILSLNSIPDIFGVTEIVVTADDGHGRAQATTSFAVTVNDVYDFPTWNANIGDGDLFIFDLDGELLDLSGAVDTHGQNNTAPIGYTLLPIPNVEGNCYDIIPSENPLYGLIITPTGYQPDNWHILYPDQHCILILDGGDQVEVILRTNLSPYIFAIIPDVDIFVGAGWFAYVDLDGYFQDPEGLELTYNAVYEPDKIDVFIDGSNTINLRALGWSGDTDVTVVATDINTRATASQTFTVTIIDIDRSAVDEPDVEPEVFVTALGGNFPNPFNPETTISFSLQETSEVELVIFNMKGQKVATLISGTREAGEHQILWNGTDDKGHKVGSGIYFSRMTTGDYQSMRKMILMK